MGSSQNYPVAPAAESAGVAVSGTGIYLGGYFAQGPATFGSVSLQGQGDEDGFVARLNSDGSTAWAFGIGSPVRTIDNSTAGYSETGTGWKPWSQGDGYLGNARYHGSAKGADTASWQFTNLPDGTYQVLGHWPANSKNATNAPFAISSGGSSTTVLMNQTLPVNDVIDNLGQGWRILGSFAVSGGTVTVTLNDKANGNVLADAIRVVFQTPPGMAPAAAMMAGTTSLMQSTREMPVLALSPTGTARPVTVSQGSGSLGSADAAEHGRAAWVAADRGRPVEQPAEDMLWHVRRSSEPADFVGLPLPDDLFGDVFGLAEPGHLHQ